MQYRPRELTGALNHAVTVDRVVALMGPRQAGKTTLVRHLLRTGRATRYYNLKDVAVRQHLAVNARREFQHFHDHLIILDEVQQQPDLLGLIQVLVDDHPEVKGQFLLLGSNHLLLNRQVKESLAGRVALFTLFPLSFHEWLSSQTNSLLTVLLACDSAATAESVLADFYVPADRSRDLAAAWHDFTMFGGFPEFLTRRDPDDRRRWLRDYHQSYLETDLRELVRLRNPESFEVFEKLLATRVGSLINFSGIAADAGLSVDSVRRFLHYFRQLFMTWECSPFHVNLASRVRKSPKWYFTDVGPLRSLLADWRPENGHIFENCVMSELRKGLYHEQLGEDLYFSRTTAGAEIDGVFKGNNGAITFLAEIKAGTTVRRGDLRHLRRQVGARDDRIGLVLGNTPGIERLSERVWSVPAAWLLA